MIALSWNNKQRVAIIDFCGQYTQLIARRIREFGVYSSIHSYTITLEEMEEINPAGIIFSGGPSSVYEEGAPTIDPRILELEIPILGICYGMQLLVDLLPGGKVAPCYREYGRVELQVEKQGSLFKGIEEGFTAWMSHGDSAVRLPPGFDILASTEQLKAAAVEDRTRDFYGVQFHPEVTHSLRGRDVLKNFLFSICSLSSQWQVEDYISDKVADLRKQIVEMEGAKRALCAVSGGIDSALSCLLMQEAIGKRLFCVFVDHGLLRKDEPEVIRNELEKCFGDELIYIDAGDRFLSALKGVVDPEMKRKVIGREFIKIFKEEAERLGGIECLVQGTIYSDIIESGSDQATTIKSHHNVRGLPEDHGFEIIEPLKYFFKDEVLDIARLKGLPEYFIKKQSFPGPGLAIRIIGEVTKERLELLREADHIFNQELSKAGLEDQIWQSFVVLPSPVRSVGVQGDRRSYQHPIILRAVESSDTLTAGWVQIPYPVLERVSERIINELSEINRVLYDLTTKPPATIEWE